MSGDHFLAEFEPQQQEAIKEGGVFVLDKKKGGFDDGMNAFLKVHGTEFEVSLYLRLYIQTKYQLNKIHIYRKLNPTSSESTRLFSRTTR